MTNLLLICNFIASLFGNLCTGSDSTIAENPSDSIIIEHEYVDLGLPSGTLWATCNIGAEHPWESGYYFAWGEIFPQVDNEFSWESYKWWDEESQNGKEYTGNWDGNHIELLPEDDAATTNWGEDWSIPSITQISELLSKEYTYAEMYTICDVDGWKVTSKINGNSIFFPHNGYRAIGSLFEYGTEGHYWSKSNIRGAGRAISLCLSMGFHKFMQISGKGRFHGLSIRPVRKKTENQTQTK